MKCYSEKQVETFVSDYYKGKYNNHNCFKLYNKVCDMCYSMDFQYIWGSVVEDINDIRTKLMNIL